MFFFKFFRKREKRYKVIDLDIFNEINIYVFISIKMFENYRFKFKKAYKKIKNDLRFLNFYCAKEIAF